MQVPVHLGIKGNIVTDKAGKEVIDMSETDISRLLYADYPVIKRGRNS